MQAKNKRDTCTFANFKTFNRIFTNKQKKIRLTELFIIVKFMAEQLATENGHLFEKGLFGHLKIVSVCVWSSVQPLVENSWPLVGFSPTRMDTTSQLFPAAATQRSPIWFFRQNYGFCVDCNRIFSHLAKQKLLNDESYVEYFDEVTETMCALSAKAGPRKKLVDFGLYLWLQCLKNVPSAIKFDLFCKLGNKKLYVYIKRTHVNN